MEEKDIEGILKKVEELKAVFDFGVRFVPFLEELLIFVQEMSPKLNEMYKSIQENSSKMPEAARQLDKVDSILSKLDEINQNFQEVSRRLVAEREVISEITGSIEKLLKISDTHKKLSKVFENKEARELGIQIKAAVDKFLAEKVDESLPDKVDQLLQDTKNDASDIMNALQVQEILPQQIESAQALLSSIQERLNSLIVKYSEAEPTPAIVAEAGAREEVVEELRKARKRRRKFQKNFLKALRLYQMKRRRKRSPKLPQARRKSIPCSRDLKQSKRLRLIRNYRYQRLSKRKK